MLRWRLILGVVIVAAVAAICWLDARGPRPGMYLGALAIIAAWLCAGELLAMFRARGFAPSRNSFYAGAMLPVALSCVPIVLRKITFNSTMGAHGWLAVGLAAGLATAFASEMRRFGGASHSIVNVAIKAFAVLYVGGCLGTLVQLRLVRAPMDIGGVRGLAPLLLTIATVKLSDICQYAVGRTTGRHKIAPQLSPGKTWEGAVGGIVVACAIVSLSLGVRLVGSENLEWRALAVLAAFTASIAMAGLFGDLAESLLKRNAGVKDSSTWLPGFGGVLDLMDSLLLAGPVAFLWFANGFLANNLAG